MKFIETAEAKKQPGVGDTARALDSILLEHRDFIYREYLELPLAL